MQLPLSGFTPDSPLITAESQHNSDALVHTGLAKAGCCSLTSLHDRLTPDVFCVNDSASCSRGESTATCMRSPAQREVASGITGTSHLTLKESLLLLPDFPFRPEVDGSSATQNDRNAMWMWTDGDRPFRVKTSRDGAAGTPLVLPSEEELENVASMAAALSQPLSPWMAAPSSEGSHPTLQKECVAFAGAETLQGHARPSGLMSFSPSSAMSATSLQFDQLHVTGSIRCNSTPALRKTAKGHEVQVLSSPPAEDMDRPCPVTVNVAALTRTGPMAHHRDESSTTQLQDEVSLTSSSGLCASCLRAPTSIPGATLESVAAVAFAGAGPHEFSLCSPSSSMLTFVDHDLDITTDPTVLPLGDGLPGTSEAGSLLDGEGGLRPSGTRHYFLASKHPSLSGGPMMPLASKSTALHRCRPAMVTSVTRPAQLTSEYAAAVEAAAAYGHSLRQILARCSDDADDALRDSGEMSSELCEGRKQ